MERIKKEGMFWLDQSMDGQNMSFFLPFLFFFLNQRKKRRIEIFGLKEGFENGKKRKLCVLRRQNAETIWCNP